MNSLDTEIQPESIIHEIFESASEKSGDIDIPDQSNEPCSYSFSKRKDGSIGVSISISFPSDSSWKNKQICFTVDSYGLPYKGFVNAVTSSGVSAEPYIMNIADITKYLNYFKPVLQKTKNDELARKEKERKRQLPRIVRNFRDPINNIPTEAIYLDEFELREHAPYLTKDSKDLPFKTAPLFTPGESFRNIYLQTDSCYVLGTFDSAVGTMAKTLGAYIFCFPRLTGKNAAPIEIEQNQWNTDRAVVYFPVTHENKSKIHDIWSKAYYKITQGATDKEVYDFLFQKALIVEREAAPYLNRS